MGPGHTGPLCVMWSEPLNVACSGGLLQVQDLNNSTVLGGTPEAASLLPGATAEAQGQNLPTLPSPPLNPHSSLPFIVLWVVSQAVTQLCRFPALNPLFKIIRNIFVFQVGP